MRPRPGGESFGLHPIVPYLAVGFGSYYALVSAWESLRERSIDVNLLMVLAAIGAVAVGQPLDAATLLFLFSPPAPSNRFTSGPHAVPPSKV